MGRVGVSLLRLARDVWWGIILAPSHHVPMTKCYAGQGYLALLECCLVSEQQGIVLVLGSLAGENRECWHTWRGLELGSVGRAISQS